MTALHAARVAARLRRELGLQVEMRRGPYGRFEVLVDDEVVIDGGRLALLGVLPSGPEIVDEIRRRLSGAGRTSSVE